LKILAIAAHPDDETLGCAGTLLKHRADGDEVAWLIVSKTHEPQWTPEMIARKSNEVDAVAKRLGTTEHRHLDFPAAALETVPLGDIMKAIKGFIDEVRPDVVYLVHGGDVHTDHRVVYDATMSVIKPFHMAGLGIRRVESFEIPSSTDAAAPHTSTAFMPTVFRDISDHLEAKLELFALYASEAQPDPMSRGPSAVRAWARARGATIGVEYAEAFMLLRELA
jgi:N-acetylglucosamine malate deacetylase 1